MMNRAGESGSPCRTPRAKDRGGPRPPLSRIDMVAVRRMAEIQPRHLLPKPSCARTLNRNSQDKVSKAFVISILSRTAGIFFLCSVTAVLRTSLKFSWIQRFVMKADCTGDTNLPITGESRSDINLVMILEKLCIKLIGRKSLTSSGSSFFGSSVRLAELSL